MEGHPPDPDPLNKLASSLQKVGLQLPQESMIPERNSCFPERPEANFLEVLGQVFWRPEADLLGVSGGGWVDGLSARIFFYYYARPARELEPTSAGYRFFARDNNIPVPWP